jgi:hypothetical protein
MAVKERVDVEGRRASQAKEHLGRLDEAASLEYLFLKRRRRRRRGRFRRARRPRSDS